MYILHCMYPHADVVGTKSACVCAYVSSHMCVYVYVCYLCMYVCIACVCAFLVNMT